MAGVQRAHLILYVADQARSARFYAAALGVEPTLDVPGMTEFAVGPGAVLGLMPRSSVRRLLPDVPVDGPGPGPGPSPARAEVYLVVDDPRAYHLRALVAGARELSPPLPRDWGHVVGYCLDPDGHVLGFAHPTRADAATMVVHVDWHQGDRGDLRPLFELAEDSTSQLDAYLGLGRVLVATVGDEPVGHLQLVPTGQRGEIEVKNMAVAVDHQGSGVGRSLVESALRRCSDESWERVVVATAAADVGALRFYQRCGFRFASIERDAFVPATGYPDRIDVDGVPLRDRVWLDQRLAGPVAPPVKAPMEG